MQFFASSSQKIDLSSLQKHQIQFTQKDFQKIKDKYQRRKNSSYADQYLLILAKSYFIQQNYQGCIQILKKITNLKNAKILFQRQALLFKAGFLVNSRKLQLIQILQQFQVNKTKVTTGSFLAYHYNVFKQFRDFLTLIQTKKSNREALYVQSDQQNTQVQQIKNQMKDKQKENENSKKYEGFPCFLVESRWYKKHLNYMYSKKTNNKIQHPGIISNFSIVNHIYELLPYQQSAKSNLNIILFPGAFYETVTKKHWAYLKNNYQGIPLRRAYIKMESFHSQISYNQKFMIKTCVRFKDKIQIIQAYNISLWKSSIIPVLHKKYGYGQLKWEQQTDKFVLVGDKNIFKIKNGLPLKYVLIQGYETNNKLTDQQKRFQQNLTYIYDFQKYSMEDTLSKGLVGLTNDKYFCFMNSTLQCLNFNYQLSKFFVQNYHLPYLNFSAKNVQGSRGQITCAYADIIKKSWTFKKEDRNKQINPAIFKQVFAKRFQTFLQDSQQDAHEFLNFLLNCMHDDLNSRFQQNINKKIKQIKDTTNFNSVRQIYSQNYQTYNESKISDLFKCYTYSTLHCLGCETNYYNFDIHLTIPLPLPRVNPFIIIYYLNSQHLDTQAQRYRIYLSNVTELQDLINLIKKHRYQQKSNKILPLNSQFQLFGINNKNFKLIKTYDNKTTLKQLLKDQKNLFLFLYQIVKPKPKQTKKIIQNHSQDNQQQRISQSSQDQHKLTLIQYIQGYQRKGYPKLAFIDPLSSQQDLLKIAASSIFQQSLNISGGVATQKQKLQCIDKVKLQKVNTHQIFQHILKIHLKKNISMFQQKQRIQDVGESSTDKKIDLYKCFQMNMLKDKIQLQEEWKCGKCKKICQAQKQQKIYSVSSHLIIVLKRFQGGQKIYAKVDYPIEGLDIMQFLDEDFIKRNKNQKYIYDLYGVIVHRGTMNRGHYYSFCKNEITQKWYELDDQSVRQIDQSSLVDQNAYILFYKKKDI